VIGRGGCARLAPIAKSMRVTDFLPKRARTIIGDQVLAGTG
jgi:hypothetical protein